MENINEEFKNAMRTIAGINEEKKVNVFTHWAPGFMITYDSSAKSHEYQISHVDKNGKVIKLERKETPSDILDFFKSKDIKGFNTPDGNHVSIVNIDLAKFVSIIHKSGKIVAPVKSHDQKPEEEGPDNELSSYINV
jgi:hypothetical protein